MKHKVFVDGQEGTTGLRIHEYLARRDDIELLRIDAEKRKDAARRAELLNAADVAFLCLPDGAAREAVILLRNPKTCLIDASTAHRTDPQWVFGLPELAPGQREKIRASKRIANPGCHALSFILLLRPLVDAGLVGADQAISATSISGYSGGGRKMIDQYQGGNVSGLDSPRPYSLRLAHKHLPEMVTHTGLRRAPIFMPIVANYYKGLAVSVPLELSQLGARVTGELVHKTYEERYRREPFISLQAMFGDAHPAPEYFDVQGSNDTNRVDIFVFANETQALLIARLDNLGKGASGTAVQAMNVHLGVDESLGL
ncbi:MAG: N-acetyl-gamma-glutamyl-phosphate reductase [Burkholderiaceae bacterium]